MKHNIRQRVMLGTRQSHELEIVGHVEDTK